jgi:ABC-type nickel/cobalt efflux system permease component RcnA
VSVPVASVDGAIGGLAAGHGAAVAIAVAFALGLRHAADPDHLVAVTTLVASTRERAAGAAARLGAAWGAGHALTLLAFGLPVLLLRAVLPGWLENAAEVAVGTIVAALAVRLLVRWRRGAFHVHVHEHAGVEHAHLHSHADEVEHAHAHAHRPRTPWQAFGIGLVHGTAGSAGVTVLVIASVPTTRVAVAALLVLVCGTAVSMTLLSAAAGRLLAGTRLRRRFARATPLLAAVALVFGAAYIAAALGVL